MIADVLWRCAWCPRHRRLAGRQASAPGSSPADAPDDAPASWAVARPCAAGRACASTWPAALASAPVSRGLRSPSNRARGARPDDPAWWPRAAPRAGGSARRCRRTRNARRSPRWGSPDTAPAAQAPQRPVVGQPLDERPRGGDVEHRLGDEGARYGRTVVLRPASQLQGCQQALNPYELDDSHERLVALPQGTKVLLKRRKQLRLKGTPVPG